MHSIFFKYYLHSQMKELSPVLLLLTGVYRALISLFYLVKYDNNFLYFENARNYSVKLLLFH